MLLSEDQFVIDALIKILAENYESLEYDQEGSGGMDSLKVKKKNPTETLDFSIANSIKRALEKVTNRSFYPPGNAGTGDRNSDTDWSSFNIREKKR